MYGTRSVALRQSSLNACYASSNGEGASVMRMPYFGRSVTRGRGTTGQPGMSFGV